MTKNEALRLALEALKEIIHWYAVRDRNDVLLNFVDQNPEIKKAMKAITSVEAALEAKDEPDKYAMDIECTKCGAKQSGVLTVHATSPKQEVKDEPVGEVSDHDWSTGLLYRDLEPGTPLYTTPPQRTWVGLTNKDWNRSKHNYDFQKGVDWAESILKEKNT